MKALSPPFAFIEGSSAYLSCANGSRIEDAAAESAVYLLDVILHHEETGFIKLFDDMSQLIRLSEHSWRDGLLQVSQARSTVVFGDEFVRYVRSADGCDQYASEILSAELESYAYLGQKVDW